MSECRCLLCYVKLAHEYTTIVIFQTKENSLPTLGETYRRTQCVCPQRLVPDRKYGDYCRPILQEPRNVLNCLLLDLSDKAMEYPQNSSAGQKP